MYYWEHFLSVAAKKSIDTKVTNWESNEKQTLASLSLIYDYYFLCVAIIILDVQTFFSAFLVAIEWRCEHAINIKFDDARRVTMEPKLSDIGRWNVVISIKSSMSHYYSSSHPQSNGIYFCFISQSERDCHSRSGAPAHNILIQSIHISILPLPSPFCHPKEVETFWQLIKDLGIMLDMSLSIRMDCERHNSDGLQVFVDFSDLSMKGELLRCVTLCQKRWKSR